MRLILRGFALAAAIFGAAAAEAGPYSDDLAKCLVAKTTDADKALLVRWIFAAMSASATVRDVAATTPAIRHEYAVKGAALFQRLMAEDCRTETAAALKYEGVGAFEKSFGVLGEVATRSLFNDPAVQAEVDSMVAQLDPKKFEALSREFGLQPPRPGK